MVGDLVVVIVMVDLAGDQVQVDQEVTVDMEVTEVVMGRHLVEVNILLVSLDKPKLIQYI